MLISLDLLQLGLGANLALSGMSKVALPSVQAECWPRLPKWFWPSCGIWEIGSGYLMYKGGDFLDVGLTMSFVFMGGVFSSILYIKDDKGFTHFSGKGKLKVGGRLMIVPPIVFSGLLHYISSKSDASTMSLSTIGTSVLSGFVSGMICSFLGSNNNDQRTRKDS